MDNSSNLFILTGLLLVSILFWYFNIRGKTKCIIYGENCNL